MTLFIDIEAADAAVDDLRGAASKVATHAGPEHDVHYHRSNIPAGAARAFGAAHSASATVSVLTGSLANNIEMGGQATEWADRLEQ